MRAVTELLERQRTRPAVLHRVPQAVQRSDARIAAPREHEPRGAAGADQLIVDDVGRHPHESQAATLLPDHLVARGERNQVGEPLHRHDVAVVDRLPDGVLQRTKKHSRAARMARSARPRQVCGPALARASPFGVRVALLSKYSHGENSHDRKPHSRPHPGRHRRRRPGRSDARSVCCTCRASTR